MQTDRDRLIELVDKAKEEYANDITDHTETDYIVEALLNEGVMVPPCKVGDTVYILEEKCKYSGEKNEPWNSCKQYWDNVFKNKMWGCKGKDENGSLIYCKQKEMVWYVKEVDYSLFLYSNPDIVLGKKLFLTKEEAECALKECEGK